MLPGVLAMKTPNYLIQHLDCRQWARICKMAGMKGIIFTAKHHSGFCLWPSKFTDYSVKNIPWRNGQADIVRELADACKEYGLKFGIYLSPWDRNHAEYGKPEYIQYFRNQLRELLTNYGEILKYGLMALMAGLVIMGEQTRQEKLIQKPTMTGKIPINWCEHYNPIL